jgi:hypothetical protein
MLYVQLIMVLLCSFIRVKKLLSKYHPGKFKHQRIAIINYFLFDLNIYLTLIILKLLYHFGSKGTDGFTSLYWILAGITYLFPFIQSFGIFFFKQSIDPLSNVSSLGYLKLVSINQTPTESYWGSMITEETIEK